jgi:hypothetical protein
VHPSADCILAVILTSDFPSLTKAPRFLRSMNAQSSFKQGEPSDQVTTLLKHVQLADPGSLNINEDNMCRGWGHDQFTEGGISPSTSLTSWQDVGNVATAFKLVAAALKTCREACLMCAHTGTPETGSFISDIYLEQTLERLEECWVGAGGVRVHFLSVYNSLIFSRPFPLTLMSKSFLLRLHPIAMSLCHPQLISGQRLSQTLSLQPLPQRLPWEPTLPSTSSPPPAPNPCRSPQQE